MTLIIFDGKKLYADKHVSCNGTYMEKINKIQRIENGVYAGAGENRIVDFVRIKLSEYTKEKRSKDEFVLFFCELMKTVQDLGFDVEAVDFIFSHFGDVYSITSFTVMRYGDSDKRFLIEGSGKSYAWTLLEHGETDIPKIYDTVSRIINNVTKEFDSIYIL